MAVLGVQKFEYESDKSLGSHRKGSRLLESKPLSREVYP